MAFVKLIPVASCRESGGTFVESADKELAVFLIDGGEQVVVADNACPHASGNLSGGDVVDGVVICPWHEWRFDLRSGVCVHSDKARLRRYAAKVEDNFVWVDLDSEQ